ncbi:MAG: hypothetical protein HY903_02575 [Deltaproteobacteria bacterium]|nr:hypothetical protein [Deltaproteobacteria bacterium]
MTRWLVLLSLPLVCACGGASDNGAGPPGTPPGSITPAAIVAGGDCPAPSGAGVGHSGILAANETWSAAASPHHVTGRVLLRQNAILTIEPCAVVLLDPGLGFDIGGANDAGKLVASGTFDGSTLRPIRRRQHLRGRAGVPRHPLGGRERQLPGRQPRPVRLSALGRF